MQSTVGVSIDVELAEVEAAVGATSFKRGKTYARAHRVLAVAWDEDRSLLRGRVVGNGALYDTTVSFSRSGDDLEFDEGDCSCPIGWNCKHVAALVITASPAGGAHRPGTARCAAFPARARPPDPGLHIRDSEGRFPQSRDQAQEPSMSDWEQPLRAMIAAPILSASGDPLAIELGVVFNSFGSSVGAPRLQARLMRPGARGGWVNGSLSWATLESWNLREASYREDHLALAREFHAVHQARLATSSRYYYGRGDRDRTLDLSEWDATQLWSLLDQAARLGMVAIHPAGRLGEVPRYRCGELVLDVTAAPDGGRRLGPAVRTEGADDLGDCVPLLFLGANGHGLVLVKQTAGAGIGGPTGVHGGDLTGRPLRLLRLARDTPVELQRMLLDGADLAIPAEGVARFATQLAPALRHVAPVVSSDNSFAMPEVSGPELVLRAHHGSDHITSVAWMWSYAVGDERAEFALHGNASASGLRDVEAERAILDVLDLRNTGGLADLGLLDGEGRPAADVVPLHGLDTVRFVTEALPALGQLAELATEVSGEPPDYRDAGGSLEIGVSTTEIAGDHDWFDLNVTITVEGRELPFASVFAAIARGEERMLLDDGAHFSLLAPELESLRQLIEEARAFGEGTRPDSLRVSRYQAGLWEELVGLGVVREQAESWRRQVEGLLGLERLVEQAAPAGLEASLRPYQLEGFRWLASLWNLGLGGILADDMGLGKTIQALALICHALDNAVASATASGPLAGGATRPFLVIAPTSVVPNWVSEADRFTPGLTVRAMTDTISRAGVPIEDVAAGADIVVTTYTLARMDEGHYGGIEWAGVILDEAQAVKNHSAKTHAAVRRLRTPFKLAITGTPMENNLGELWALLSITAPGLFPDPVAFGEHYARPIERHADGERLALLRRRIRPLVKRRTKDLVAADLPAKQEQILEVELHPRHRKLYDTHMQRERQRILGLLDDFDANRFMVLSAITRMRQVSLHAGLVDEEHLKVPSAKLDELTKQLTDVVRSGHRALVFSQFTRFLAIVRERLDTDGIGYCYLDGRTRNRGKVLARFKQGDDPVFLISLKAGGFGLNLMEADYCFLLDPWWNPATETQAIDRTHRIGQTRPVMVYRLVSGNTIEQKVVALAARKAALFRGVMDDGDLFAGQITADDIRGLLS